MPDFDAETALVLGGWHPRYARIMDVQVDGEVAAALVDSNGDGADINVDVYLRGRDGEWDPIASGNGSMGFPGGFATWTEEDRLVLVRHG